MNFNICLLATVLVLGLVHQYSIIVSAKQTVNYRLPSNLQPYVYYLHLNTKFDVFTQPEQFDGTVSIDIECVLATDELVLHADSDFVGVKNKRVIVRGITDPSFEINGNQVGYDGETEFLTFKLAKKLKQNYRYRVFMEFFGKISKARFGLFSRSYSDSQNKTRWMVGSQMEAMSARNVFPCFDEPAMKAQFKISIQHHKSLNASSNMAIKSETQMNENYIRTEFDQTVRMSTYLLGFYLNDFACKHDIANAGYKNYLNKTELPLRACSRPSGANKLDFALNATRKSIEFLQDLFQIEYPLQKLDSFAVPQDHSAMENFGIFRYAENVFIIDQDTPQRYIEDTALIIAHEVAHTWLGNLVTPQWWNDIWMKEGLATYFEYLTTDNSYRNFKIFDELQIMIFGTMNEDTPSNHFLSLDYDVPVSTYTSTIYMKGAAIIKMMTSFLSKTTVIAAIRNMLGANLYSTISQRDLWQYVTDQIVLGNHTCQMNISEIMTTWTRQAGYPVVTIKRLSENKFELTQRQYLSKEKKNSVKPKWFIPFTYAQLEISESNQSQVNINENELHKQIVWLLSNEASKIIELTGQVNNETFILGNLYAAGYYKVNYDADSWDLIIQQLKTNPNAIPTKSRAQLINDVFSHAKSGLLNATVALKLISYLSSEENNLPWKTFLRINFDYMTTMISSSDLFHRYRGYLLDILAQPYEKFGLHVGFKDDWTVELENMRTMVIELACRLDHVECVISAQKMFSDWMNGENRIWKSFREIVYCTAIRHGSSNEWDFLNSQFAAETDEIQREVMQQALACSKEPLVLTKYFETQLGLHNCVKGLSHAYRSYEGNLLLWIYLRKNYGRISQNCNDYEITLNNLIEVAMGKLKTKSQLKQVVKFFKKFENTDLSLDAASETINENIQWFNRNYDDLAKFLTRN